MSEKRLLWAVIGGLLLCFKMCVLATKSSRNSYSSYSSSSYDPYGLKKRSYDSYGRNKDYQALKDELDRANLELQIEKELETTVQRNCSVARSNLRLEIDFTEPGMASLMREANRASLPSGTWLPAPLVAQGLAVTLKDGRGEGSRLCLDADESLLNDVLARTRPSAELVKVGPGVWSVKTTDGTGSSALLSSAVLDGLKVKGSLVAFIPTDELVVFADSANTAAIAQAAKYAAEHTATNGDDGCVAIEPLVRTNGSWGTWLPNGKPSKAREVEAARAAARECYANLVGSYLQTLVVMREAKSGVPFVETFDASERSFTATQSTVSLALDDDTVPQLVSPAQQVKLVTDDGRELTMTWETFVALGGTRLTPVVVKDTTVPNSFFFTGGMVAADFAGKKGVTSKKQL